MPLDPFTVKVYELREWLASQPDEARVVITPPDGRSFSLLGWVYSAVGIDGQPVVVLTGGAYSEHASLEENPAGSR